MASQGFHRDDSDFSKRQVFPQLSKTSYSCGRVRIHFLWICLLVCQLCIPCILWWTPNIRGVPAEYRLGDVMAAAQYVAIGSE